MMGAYVEGLPIPFSSRVFTIVASVNRGGPMVKCCSGMSFSRSTSSPVSSGGSAFVCSFDARRESAFWKPFSTTFVLDERNRHSPAEKSTLVVLAFEGDICEETNLSQMIEYNRNSS